MPPRKNPGERRSTDHAILRANIAELEHFGNEYADFMLMDTPVHIDLANVKGNYTPPDRAVAIFRNRGIVPPRFVDRVNIDLDYSPDARQFSVKHGAVMFDNGYGLSVQNPVYIEEEGGLYHSVDLFRFGPRIKPKLTPIAQWPTEVVQNFFTHSGLSLPIAPREAAWEAVIQTIEKAQHSVTTAQKLSYLSSNLALIVTEQVVQTSPILSEDDFKRNSPAWLRRYTGMLPDLSGESKPNPQEKVTIRELSMQSVDYSQVTVRSIEAVLRSRALTEDPKFRGVYLHSGAREITAPANYLYTAEQPVNNTAAEGELIVDPAELSKAVSGIMKALRTAGGNFLG